MEKIFIIDHKFEWMLIFYCPCQIHTFKSLYDWNLLFLNSIEQFGARRQLLNNGPNKSLSKICFDSTSNYETNQKM